MSVRRPPENQSRLESPDLLTALWREALAWEPFRYRSLWLLFIDRDLRPAGPLVTVDDLPDGPYGVPLTDLEEMCRAILDGPGGGGSVALLMSRTGGPPWTVSDRAWGRFLLQGAAAIGGTVWPVHLAHIYGIERFQLPATR